MNERTQGWLEGAAMVVGILYAALAVWAIWTICT